MRLDSRSELRGMLMNAETGQPIRFAVWAEIPEDPEQQGEFEAFRMNPEEARRLGIPLSEIRYKGKARLRFIPRAPHFKCTPTSQRDLSGSLEDARQSLGLKKPVGPPVLLMPCEYPGCHEIGRYKTSDEQEIDPERDEEGRLHERAVTMRAHFYCAKHFRLPTFTTARGVQREEGVEEGRPK